MGQQRVGEVEVDDEDEGAFDSAAAGEDRRGCGRSLLGELIGRGGILGHCQWAGGCRLFHWAAEDLAMARLQDGMTEQDSPENRNTAQDSRMRIRAMDVRCLTGVVGRWGRFTGS